MSITATAAAKILPGSQIKEQSDTKENLEKIDLIKNRCLMMAHLFKSELETKRIDAFYLMYAWYTQSEDASILRLSNPSINIETCFESYQFQMSHFLRLIESFYAEIESTNSLEKLYDVQYAALLEMQYLREEVSLTKEGNITLEDPGTARDESVKSTLIYQYCTRMINMYKEMLDIITPAIDERQISFWLSNSIIVTPKSERKVTGKFQVTYAIKLSELSRDFIMAYESLFQDIVRAGREHPEFSPLFQNSIKKAESILADFKKLADERRSVASKGYVSRESTRETFYSIVGFMDALKDVRADFEHENRILAEKLKLEKLKKLQKSESDKVKKSEATPKVGADHADDPAKKAVAAEQQRAVELKKAEETFRAYEEEQRRKLAEYRAQTVEKRKEKARLKLSLKKQLKTGKTLENSISTALINNLKSCTAEELQVIQAIIGHSAVEEGPVHNVLIKLGFLPDKVSSQGFNYKLGPFSATFHPAHAASANAGLLHPNFVSKLRRIFWGVGFDQELIGSFQKRLSFKTLKLKEPAGGQAPKTSALSAAAKSASTSAAAAKPASTTVDAPTKVKRGPRRK